MGNGEWEWRMENGEWRMENGEWRMGNGEWRMGEWGMENGEWGWGMGNEWGCELTWVRLVSLGTSVERPQLTSAVVKRSSVFYFKK